jgi:hypothetical protein
MISTRTLAAIPLALMVAASAAYGQPEQPTVSDTRIAYARHAGHPRLEILTPASMTVLAVGGFTRVPDGNRISSEFELEDPANKLSAGVARLAAQSNGFQFIETPIETPGDDGKLALTLAKENGAKYLIYAGTMSLLVRYFSFDFSHYKVTYSGLVSIYDTDSRKVRYNYNCYATPKRTADQPTLDQMLENRGALLTQMADASAALCLDKMKAAGIKLTSK